MLPEVTSVVAPETTVYHHDGSTRVFLRLLSCVRYEEILVLSGSPLLGAFLSMGNITIAKAAATLLLAAGNGCLVAHVFLLNDLSGISADLQDPNRPKVFTAKGIDRAQIKHLCMALGVLGLLLLSPFGSQTLTIALIIDGVSALYSAPEIHMKGTPLLNSMLHFTGGLMHFLLGYSIFRGVDGRGLEIACFFALIFVAGHLTHEVRDCDADLLNGITTNAVALGKKWIFVSGLVIFMIADVLLAALAGFGAVPRALVVVAALGPLHLYWSLQALDSGLTFESIRRLQVRYRGLYAAIGFMMVAAALLASRAR